MAKILWNPNGWTTVCDADANKHTLGVSCRCEDGMVVEVRYRHNDGEEEKANLLIDGKPALPMSTADFEENLRKEKFSLK